ncbi:TniQ family protein [Celeribacter sp.]|uniref:TniQ family protein n=1 Tax=Celeribacter sp. TaxID=1890673 RepID=UPI003A94D0C5
MTNFPISSPTPVTRETLYSYLARLASNWQTDAVELVYDMGASFKRLLDQDGEAHELFARWAKLSPEVMAEMLSWTGVRAGNVRMEFRGELYVSRALRNPVMRGCPMCLREDAAETDRPAHEVMAMRGDWQFREVILCVRHGHPIVPLWRVTALRDRFSIGARLQEIAPDVLSGAFDQPMRTPSAYDLWLDRRLEDGSDPTWLADHPVFVVTTLCRLLGQDLLNEDSIEDEHISDRVHLAGFNIMRAGEGAIRDALDHVASLAMDAQDEPSKTFGPLYTQLNRAYLKEPNFDPFRNILREVILDHWPFADGDVILGQTLPQRRLHSLRTAALEIGVGTTLLEHFLIEAGAIYKNDPRPESRRLFDAQDNAELLAEIPTLVGPIAMRTAMGATQMELIALAEADVLRPRTRAKKVKKPWRVSDGVALVSELSDGAIAVDDDDTHWETLLRACRRRKIGLSDLIERVRDKCMTVGQRNGEVGFHGIVVPKSEVEAITPKPGTIHGTDSEELRGMAAAAFGRSVGLRDGGVFQALIEAGHVSARRIINPRTKRKQYWMEPEDMASFHLHFVTLTTLSAEKGLHRNTLKGLLASGRVSPFSPDGQDFGAVYLRDDVIKVAGLE